MFKCSNIKINKYKFMVHLDCVVLVCQVGSVLNRQSIISGAFTVKINSATHYMNNQKDFCLNLKNSEMCHLVNNVNGYLGE